MVKKRPGGYTYYGGNTNLSEQYKDRFIPKYNPATTMSNTESTTTVRDLKKSMEWNKYQTKTWYQDHLDHTTPEFEDFPGIHAEWKKEGEFEKSYRQYNSKFAYDFRVNVKTTRADGSDEFEEFRTADHTKIQKMRKFENENELYDTKHSVDFNEVKTPPKDLSRNVSEGDIMFFNREPTPASSRHPAINSTLCRENPRETFRQKEKFPLFWSEKQEKDFKESKSTTSLLDASLGRSGHGFTKQSESDPYPYGSRPMTSHQITLRNNGSRDPPVTLRNSFKAKSMRRPQSGYERGLSGTLQKNDGWRDEELLSNAGKISFYPLSFDVLETLTFPPIDDEMKKKTFKPLSPTRAALVNQVFDALSSQSNSSDEASIHVILSAFSAHAHPVVVSNRVSEQDLCDSLILDLYKLTKVEAKGRVCDVFHDYAASDVVADVRAGEEDFAVSRSAFTMLYQCYSQGIHSDEYFRQLISRSWLSIGLPSPCDKKVLKTPYIQRVNSSINLLK